MQNVFVIENDSGSGEVRVSAAEILFLQNGSSWTVGIHVSGFDTDSDYVPLHLIDFPIDGHADPRQRESFQISIPEGDDGLDKFTNLCVGEHTATDNNQIVILRLPDGRFRVQWSGVSEDFGDRFRMDVVANEVSSILYP